MTVLIGVHAAAVIFALLSMDLAAPKWAAMQLALFALPAATMLVRSESLRIAGAWSSVFLVLQALLSPLVLDADFKSLPPNMRQTIDPKAELPGITGEQVITTDAMGFRTTKPIDYASDKTYRVFAIGGSTAEQIYLDDKRTWAHLLQQELDKQRGGDVEVVNTGVSGLRARHHLATLKRIAPLNPDVVLLLVGINDWNHHIASHVAERDASETVLGRLRGTMEAWRSPLVERFTLQNSVMAAPLRILMQTAQGGPPAGGPQSFTGTRNSLARSRVVTFKPDKVAGDYAEAISDFGEECRRLKVRCVLVTQPTGYQAAAADAFRLGFWMTPPFQDYTLDFDSMVHVAALYNRFLADFASRSGHALCDAAAAFAPSFENFYDDCHFNTKGAERMSQTLARCLAP